jgi:hypothetical protein
VHRLGEWKVHVEYTHRPTIYWTSTENMEFKPSLYVAHCFSTFSYQEKMQTFKLHWELKNGKYCNTFFLNFIILLKVQLYLGIALPVIR